MVLGVMTMIIVSRIYPQPPPEDGNGFLDLLILGGFGEAPLIGPFLSVAFFIIAMCLWPFFILYMVHRSKEYQKLKRSAGPKKLKLGLRGKSVTALVPTGKITLDGLTHDGQAIHGSIDAEREVEVTGMQMSVYLVREVK